MIHQPFVLMSHTMKIGIVFLERPIFIEIDPARSDAVKLLPSPCRGVTYRASTRMRKHGLSTRHIPSSRCRRHPLFRGICFLSSWPLLIAAQSGVHQLRLTRSECSTLPSIPATTCRSINLKQVCQRMVESIGIEPMTSCLQSRRSPS